MIFLATSLQLYSDLDRHFYSATCDFFCAVEGNRNQKPSLNINIFSFLVAFDTIALFLYTFFVSFSFYLPIQLGLSSVILDLFRDKFY